VHCWHNKGNFFVITIVTDVTLYFLAMSAVSYQKRKTLAEGSGALSFASVIL